MTPAAPDVIHYLLECPLYANARIQLFMNIAPYTVISIENLFGSDNLTDENNLIVFRNVQKYIHHTNRFGWYEIILCTHDAIIRFVVAGIAVEER